MTSTTFILCLLLCATGLAGSGRSIKFKTDRGSNCRAKREPTFAVSATCEKNSDCSSPTPGCFEGTCVECTSSRLHCGGDEPVCDKAAHVCVECKANANCKDPALFYCDIPNTTCVECRADQRECGFIFAYIFYKYSTSRLSCQ